MSEWTSVKDKLPEEQGRYLVSGKYSDTPFQIWICDFIGIGAIRGWSNPCRNPTVSFWMPLPEPPREENYDELITKLRNNAEFLKIAYRQQALAGGFIETMRKAADAIEKLSRQKWIPITERMPDDGKFVLVYGKELHPNPHASQIEVSEVYDGNYWSGFGRTKKITHWMPLPESPKEETRA